MRQCDGRCSSTRLPAFDHEAQEILDLRRELLFAHVEIVRLKDLLRRLKEPSQ